MKIDLVLALVVGVAAVGVCIFAILFNPLLPLATKSVLAITGIGHTWMLVQFVIKKIELKRYERIDWFHRMGMLETACLIER